MKKIYLLLSTALLLAACGGKKAQDAQAEDTAADSADVTLAPRDTMPMPMIVFTTDDGYEMVYWTEVKEPETTAEPDDTRHDEWERQQMLRRNVALYTKLVTDDGKVHAIRYKDEQTKDPDGNDIFPGELHGHSLRPDCCARFVLAKGGEVVQGSVIATDGYLASRKVLKVRPLDRVGKLPATIVSQMEQKYGMKADKRNPGGIVCQIGDRYQFATLQFAGEYKKPGSKKGDDRRYALALDLIIADGDSVFDLPAEGWYDPEYGPTWNADDEGEYHASDIFAAFEGPYGLELCFKKLAPESVTTGLYCLRDGRLEQTVYAIYHSLIDEPMPLWKRDFAAMKKLYLEAEPHEHKDVELTRWCWVYVDYDSNQVMLSDKEGEQGCIFNFGNDKKFQLVGTFGHNIKPSFAHNYIVIAGPAGGPSYYYEVYHLQGGKLTETFYGTEVYGDMSECSLNGKDISTAEGAAWLKAVPEAQQTNLYWQDIEPKEQ